MKAPGTIIISRTDSIGDVMLTLPLAGLLKGKFPGVRIIFLGRSYTLPVLQCCANIDQALSLEALTDDPVRTLRGLKADAIVHVFPDRNVARWAKQAGIPLRVGTSHRWWHWFTCNKRVAFSRKKSDLHEAQLNVKLLAPLGIQDTLDLSTLAALTGFVAPDPEPIVSGMLRSDRKHLVLHPHSKGSAVEWGLDNYASLMHRLDPMQWQVLLTGTETEAARYRPQLPLHLHHVSDLGGKLSLPQLVQVIGASNALVAASTGPLHIAAASGIRAIGLYSNRRPIHPGRWAPIGRDAHALVHDAACTTCASGAGCDCITRIRPERVLDLLD
ncbi:MAG: glycosyltransferase family 9 protein [Flavobacteriales bacterium]